jgi:hypothetical protein
MEDQAFTIHAYARARSISVAADQPLYFFNRRDDGGHLTAERVDPERHVRNLRTVLDLVEAETAPGPVRDRIVRRMLRVEVLNRVSEPGYLTLSDDDQARLFVAGRDLVRERISPRVIADLGPVRRLRCELLRDDRPDDLVSLARQLHDVALTSTLDRLEWSDGALRIATTVGLRHRSTGQTLGLCEPAAAAADRVGDPYLVAADAGLIRVQLVLRARPSVLEWYVDAMTRARGDRVEATATGSIDPQRVGSGGLPLEPGTWDLLVRLTGLGIEWTGPLGTASPPAATATAATAPAAMPPAPTVAAMPPALTVAARPALLGDPARIVVPIHGADGVRVEVDPPRATIAAALRAGRIRLLRDGARIELELPMASGPGAASLTAGLILGVGDAERVIPAHLVPRSGGVVLEADLGGAERLIPGRYPMAMRLGASADTDTMSLGAAVVGPGGDVRIEGLERVSTQARLGAVAAWTATRGAKPVERLGRRLASTSKRVGHGLARRARRG